MLAIAPTAVVAAPETQSVTPVTNSETSVEVGGGIEPL
jgi:hypothetical protein